MKMYSIFVLTLAVLYTADSEATKVCEFNDPITGTTPGCTQHNIAGHGNELVFDIKLDGNHLMYVKKVRHHFPAPWCNLVDYGSSPAYYANGDCVNFRVYEQMVFRNVLVRRHTDAPTLSNADADDILSDAGSLLQTNSGSGDVSCGVTFTRSGNVVTFTAGDASIDSSAEFNALQDGVNLVNEINWCGSLRPNIIGCASTPGTRVAVVAHWLADILWAHELGHNYGLPHRSGSNLVMNPTISANGVRINHDECQAFQGIQ